MFNLKIILIATSLFIGNLANAQDLLKDFENGPTSNLEYDQGPTGKIDIDELNSIKAYAIDANVSITRLLNNINRMEENTTSGDDTNSIVNMKKKLMDGITKLIQESKDKRSVLLLTHSLQAGVILVNLIENQSINLGTDQTPPGTVSQQFRILKQSLIFARDYYESDFVFIEGVLAKQEQKTNPKFVEFGVKLTEFIIKMSNGVINVRSSYGMIRWSLAVLANYIKADKNTGIAYSSTRYNLVTELTAKNIDDSAVFPDLVNGEAAPSDIECITKIRDLKFLAKQSFEEIAAARKSLKID
jgi:hypothetical protein